MKRILLIGAVLFAAGCGGDLFHPEASPECPPSRESDVFLTVWFQIAEWEAEIQSGDRAAISVTYPGWEFPPFKSSAPIQSLTQNRYGIANSDYLVPRNTRLTIDLWADTAIHGESHADTAVVKADRECDLVVSISQSGGDLPRISGIRWVDPMW